MMRKSWIVLTVALAFVLIGTTSAYAAADLIVAKPARPGDVAVQDRYFDQYDNCSLQEWSIPSLGWHRLLTFDTDVANIGADDLKIGNPAAHPDWFTWSPCHQHYHVPLADYELLDGAGTVVAYGHKQGFCLVDSYIYDPTTARSRPRYTDCNHGQGISRGWADSYSAGLSGQWVVIDGVPAGAYTLRVTTNYLSVLPESDLTNDTASIPVTIP